LLSGNRSEIVLHRVGTTELKEGKGMRVRMLWTYLVFLAAAGIAASDVPSIQLGTAVRSKDDALVLPLQRLAPYLGLKVNYDSKSQTIRVSKGIWSATARVNTKKAQAGGKAIELPTVPWVELQKKSGVIMVPLALIATEVLWQGGALPDSISVESGQPSAPFAAFVPLFVQERDATIVFYSLASGKRVLSARYIVPGSKSAAKEQPMGELGIKVSGLSEREEKYRAIRGGFGDNTGVAALGEYLRRQGSGAVDLGTDLVSNYSQWESRMKLVKQGKAKVLAIQLSLLVEIAERRGQKLRVSGLAGDVGRRPDAIYMGQFDRNIIKVSSATARATFRLGEEGEELNPKILSLWVR
jgi:hypothetical protein